MTIPDRIRVEGTEGTDFLSYYIVSIIVLKDKGCKVSTLSTLSTLYPDFPIDGPAQRRIPS